MRNMFKRLTILYWLLFFCIGCAFLINFYSRYEDIYQTTMSEMQESATNIQDEVDLASSAFMISVDRKRILFEGLYEQNQALYNQLSETEIDLILAVNGLENLEGLTNGEKELIYNLHNIDKTLSTFLKDFDTDYQLGAKDSSYAIKDIYFIPYTENEKVNQFFKSPEDTKLIQFMKESDLEQIDGVEPTGSMEMYYYFYKGNLYTFTTIPVQAEEQLMGYYIYITENTDNMMILANNSMVRTAPLDLGVRTSCNHDFVAQTVLDYPLAEAKKILTESDYITILIESTGYSPTLLFYAKSSEFEKHIFSETLKVFEFNLILFISLFLIVSYILFASIIRPSYLLIDYVKMCSKGYYEIPKNIARDWRNIFIIIRDAYLENERLLAVKENQSQELEYAWKRALVANQAKTQFLAKVSHELRTPLNAIKGYVQLLKLTIKDTKHLRQLDIIDSSSNLLLSIVQELLDFSRIEEGKIKIDYHQVEIKKLSEMLENMFINQTDTKGVKYRVMVDPRIPNILYGDENKIKQIVINLISNAVKFTNRGSIDVLLYLDFIDAEHAYIIVKVEDTGKGIAQNKLDTIFDSFTQENNSISRKYGGTGLGLSIAKGLVEAMGGNIKVESEERVGSTFTVFIPLRLQPVEEEQVGD